MKLSNLIPIFFVGILILTISCEDKNEEIATKTQSDNEFEDNSEETSKKTSCNYGDYWQQEFYIPLPWENAIWESEFTGNDNIYHKSQFYTDGDTIINSICYITIKENHLRLSLGSNDTSSTVETVGWMRQEFDNKKVYFINALWPENEYLIYDFDLNLGDTLSKDIYKLHETAIVSAVDSIEIRNRFHYVYTIQYGQLLNAFKWIEGIGCNKGLFTIGWEFGNLTGFYLEGEKFFPE